MTEKRAKQLDVLMQMTALVNSSLDAVQIRQRAIDAVMNLMDAEAGSLLIIDEQKLARIERRDSSSLRPTLSFSVARFPLSFWPARLILGKRESSNWSE